MSSPGLRSSLGYGTGRGYKKGSADGGGDLPVSAKWPTKSGPPGLGIRETPRELRRISTLSGPSRPTKSNPKALLMSDSGIVPKIFAVAPVTEDSRSPKAGGCLPNGSTTRRSPAGSILSDPAEETAVLLLRVDPHARSEVSLRPCGACRFPSKHKRNVDHETGLEFEFGFPDFASG